MATQVHPKMANWAAHAKQPKGMKIFTETQENKRSVPAFKKDAPSHGKLKEGNLTANASQPSGKSIGWETGKQGSEVKTVPGIYQPRSQNLLGVSGAGKADGYRSAGHRKEGVLRCSGVKGAHRLGKK